MRIAISQLDGNVSDAYERSGALSIHTLDLEKGASNDEGVHPFPGFEPSLRWLEERDVQVLLTGSIDPDNAMLLGQAGVQVFTGADDMSPADNVRRFLTLVQEAMAHRSHEGGCGCGNGHCHEESDDDHECCGGHCHDGEDDHECCGGTGHDDPDHVCKCRG